MKLSKIVKEIITERYVNLLNKSDMEKYADIVWDIMQKSYAVCGGFKTAATPEDLIKKSSMWKLSRKNDKIIAAAVYKDKFGRKAIAKGSDGSQEGKEAIKSIYKADVILKRGWGEFSGKPESLMLKYGGKPVPNKYAAIILGKDIESYNPDGFHYTRRILGHDLEKIIIGDLPQDIVPTED